MTLRVAPMTFKRALIAGFVLAGSVWGSCAAQVQLPAQGVIAAKSYANVVSGSRISIEIRNFEDYSQALTGALGRALADRGFVVVDEGDLVLFVDTSTNFGTLAQPEPPPVEGSMLPDGAVERQVAVPLEREPVEVSQGVRYSMTATLAARGKPPAWVGNGSAVVSGGDRQSVFRTLGHAVVSTVGDSVQKKRVEIR